MKKAKTAQLERLARVDALLRAAAARDRHDARMLEARKTRRCAKW